MNHNEQIMFLMNSYIIRFRLVYVFRRKRFFELASRLTDKLDVKLN